jgi:hypothetical protein
MSTYLTFESPSLPSECGEILPHNQYQGVHLTLTEDIDEILETIERWFADSHEVILVDQGTTARGLHFIVMEWEACTIDPPFLEVLAHDERIEDFSVYLRDAVYEEDE